MTIRYRSPVTRLLRGAAGSINGVEIGGSTRLAADAVVCNADLPVAYRTLLGGVEAPRVARRGRYAPSCLLWVAGVRGAATRGRRAPQPALRQPMGRFGPGRDHAAGAGCAIRRSSSRSRHADSAIAPEGCTSLYVLEPMPNLDGRIDWSKERDRIAGDLRRRVAAFGYPCDVVVERVYDPLDWEAMGLERGTPFALAHTLRQSGPFRPNNVDQRVPGLVFVGSSTASRAGRADGAHLRPAGGRPRRSVRTRDVRRAVVTRSDRPLTRVDRQRLGDRRGRHARLGGDGVEPGRPIDGGHGDRFVER